MFVLTLFYFFLSENCGREAREEESGALKETRRKGEGGKDEEEVSADVKIPMTFTAVRVLLFNSVVLFYRTRSRSREHRR